MNKRDQYSKSDTVHSEDNNLPDSLINILKVIGMTR